MPLSDAMRVLAEEEVKAWARGAAHGLHPTGRMKDQVRELTAEALFRRMQEKYPDEMAIFSIDDLAESVFADGDYFNDNWFAGNAPPGARTIKDDGRMPGGLPGGDSRG